MVPGKCLNCINAEGDEQLRIDQEELRKRQAENATKLPDWMDGARHIGQPKSGQKEESGYVEVLVWSARDEHIVPIP